MKFVVKGKSGEPYDRYDKFIVSSEYFEEIIGEYYSEELETSYHLRFENNEFIIYHSRHGTIVPEILVHDIFTSEWPIASMKIILENGQPIGIRLSNSRARNLFFKKVN